MKIELRNFKMNLTFSEETIMFSADVYVDGLKAMHARNDGHGGCTDYHSYKGMQAVMDKANSYAMAQDGETFEFNGKKVTVKSTLEGLIDKLVDEKVKAKENAKTDKKKLKLMETNILFGIPNANTYSVIGFKGKPKLSLVSKTSLDMLIAKVKKELKEGEVIFNTNLK
jgi:hypothetical protein